MAKGATKSGAKITPTPAGPTSVDEWRKAARGELVTLPSGKKAVLRKPKAFAMIAKNEIPNPLLSFVVEAAGLSEAPENESPIDAKGDADYANYMLWLVSRSFVEPRFFYPDSEKPDEKVPEGWLTVEDVDDRDLMYVFSWSQQIDFAALEEALADLGPFPGGPAGGADGGDGESVRPAAEQPA